MVRPTWFLSGAARMPQGPPRLRYQAGDTVPDLHADRPHLLAHHHAAHDLVVGLVEQIQRGAIRFDQLGELAQDELEQIVQIEGGAERDAHLTQGLRDALLVTQGLDEVGPGELPLRLRQGLVAQRTAHGVDRTTKPGRFSTRLAESREICQRFEVVWL